MRIVFMECWAVRINYRAWFTILSICLVTNVVQMLVQMCKIFKSHVFF